MAGPAAELTDRAVAELVAVLDELGIEATPVGPSQDAGADLLVGGLRVAVKAASRPTLGQLRRLGVGDAPSDVVPVLVVDQLDSQARMLLHEAGWGWLDRASGHLRLMAGPVQIDRRVPDLGGPTTTLPDPLSRPTGLAVALELLISDERRSIRRLASAAQVSVASAHDAVTGLEQLHLVADGRPHDQRLFWAVAERWRVRWFPLARGPLPDVSDPVRALMRMGLEDPEAEGWAEVGDAAAQAYGARVATTFAPQLYVPDQRALTWALRTWGQTSDDRLATTFLAVPPTPRAVRDRRESRSEWPLAHPVVVALSLAADGDRRSRDVLDGWTELPQGVTRVW